MTIAFFLLTFAVTWTLWALAPKAGSVAATLFLIGTFAPSIVALALSYWRGGRDAVRALTCQIVRFPQQIQWYVFAIGYMIVIKLSTALILRASTGHWPALGTESLLLMFGVIPISLWFQAGEEIGWRAFALPRMAEAMGLGPASLLLGAIWAIWHLPLFFIQANDTFGQSFPIYFAGVVAMSVTLAWLYWRTGRSLFIVMLLHAAVNNTKDIVPSLEVGASSPWAMSQSSVALVATALMWVVAIALLWDMRGTRKITS